MNSDIVDRPPEIVNIKVYEEVHLLRSCEAQRTKLISAAQRGRQRRGRRARVEREVRLHGPVRRIRRDSTYPYAASKNDLQRVGRCGPIEHWTNFLWSWLGALGSAPRCDRPNTKISRPAKDNERQNRPLAL